MGAKRAVSGREALVVSGAEGTGGGDRLPRGGAVRRPHEGTDRPHGCAHMAGCCGNYYLMSSASHITVTRLSDSVLYPAATARSQANKHNLTF